MPLIRIEFDDVTVPIEDIQSLSQNVQQIVSEVTGIEDVFVYANSAQIKIKIAPIEIFIEMSAHKIQDVDILLKEIKERIVTWKNSQEFTHPINLTLIPMNWKMEIGI